jgi:glycosyltransferase involved in cell wall biosynthesis
MTSIRRVWQAEGTAALRDRLWDRVRDTHWPAIGWRDSGEPWPSTPVVNVIGVPLATQYGGVPLQLRTRLAREAARRPIALVSRDSNGDVRFDTWSRGGDRHRVATFPRGGWTGDPLVEDPAWVETIRTCCQLVRARGVHVENAASLSLASLVRLADVDEGIAVALSVHDFSLFCRRPHLWESCGRFCEFSTDAHRCRTCLEAAAAGVGEGFTIDQPTHRQLGTMLLAAARPIVVPSEFMRERMESLFSAIDPRVVHVIAPGIDALPAGGKQSARVADRVAIIGGAQDHKGGARLPALAAALVARGVAVTIYGGYGHQHLLALQKLRGVQVRGYFRAGLLPELLARQGAAVALALSGVPESFSLVLSEAWAAGVPVVAPALGAFRERLANGGGALVAANPSDAEILDALDRLRHEPCANLPAAPTAAAAADAHDALYRACRLITSS